MKDYIEQAQKLIERYIPLNPQKIQTAIASGGAALSESCPNLIKLTSSNYVLSGDFHDNDLDHAIEATYCFERQ